MATAHPATYTAWIVGGVGCVYETGHRLHDIGSDRGHRGPLDAPGGDGAQIGADASHGVWQEMSGPIKNFGHRAASTRGGRAAAGGHGQLATRTKPAANAADQSVTSGAAHKMRGLRVRVAAAGGKGAPPACSSDAPLACAARERPSDVASGGSGNWPRALPEGQCADTAHSAVGRRCGWLRPGPDAALGAAQN